MALDGQEWKVRGKGTWDIEIQGYNADEDTWGGVPNNKFDAEAVTVDYSDPAKFRWNICAE